MALPKTDLILGIDPGWRNIGIVAATWTSRVRRVIFRKTIVTSKTMTDHEAWDVILSELVKVFSDPQCPSVVACEDMRGVRYGHNERGTSNATTDEIRDVQAAIRTLAHIYGKRLFFVRSQSGYAAMGCRTRGKFGYKMSEKKQLQKAANAAAAMRMLSCAEDMTEHEYDACIHLGAVMLGKGVEQ